MRKTLVNKADMLKDLKKENDGSVIAVLYEDKGKTHSAVGFYYGVNMEKIDLRNFEGRIQDMLRLPEGYQILNIPEESFLEYKKLRPVERD